MTAAEFMPWRPAMPSDWLERAAALAATIDSDGDAVGVEDELRRLGGYQLTPGAQLKFERVTRRVLRDSVPTPQLRRMRVGLLGARTLSFLVAPLAAAGPPRGLLIDAVEAPFDQVAAFAYGNGPAFDDEPVDAVVAVLDAASFPQGGEEGAQLSAATALLDAIRERVSGLGVPLIMATVPASPKVGYTGDLTTRGTNRRLVEALNNRIAEGGASREWLVWDVAGLAARIGHDRWFDPVRYHLAKTPFAVQLAPVVADHLSALLAAVAGKSGRAAILDLDNTLWGGVIGDDGVSGIRLGQNSPEGEAYLAFQRFVLDLRSRGVVVAVCSKNDDAIARSPFREHPEMLLREEQIAVFQANWDDKATNIAAIAEALNLGLESLVFIDDNPAERERVRQQFATVKVPEVGEDPALFPSRILASGYFEHLPLTAEDLGRADAYGAEAKRAEIRTRSGNYEEYLTSLGMQMTIAAFDEVGLPRIAQLVSKSNQFNLRTQRYSEEQLRTFMNDPNMLCWQVRLDDAFGSHGTIAIVIVRRDADEWFIDTWLQSCRVLQRGVEAAIMNELSAAAAAAGATLITGEYIPTPRNGLVKDFFERMGFAPEDDSTNHYRLPLPEDSPRQVFIDVDLISTD